MSSPSPQQRTGAPQDRLFGRYRFERTFLVLLGASLAFRLAYTAWVPLTGDELMHWQWARHLALGYPEHPPLIAWSIAGITAALGTSQTTVRLVTVLAVTGLFWTVHRLGRELFGERAAFYGAGALMVTPIFNAGGVLANTDGLLAFFWSVAVWGLKRAVLDGRRRAWLLYGCAAGLALLSKTTALLLFPATALVLLATPEGRAWARRGEPYAAALLALLFFTPPLIWNMQHDWFTFSMRVGHQVAGGFTLKFLGELLAAQLGVVGLLLFPWAVWGLWKCLGARADSRAVLLGAFMAVPFLSYAGYSLFARAGVHWPAIGYVTGFAAAGAFAAAPAARRGATRFLVVACLASVAVTGTLMFVAVFPEKVSATWSYAGRPEKVSTSQLDNIFDWDGVGAFVRGVYDEGSGPRFLICRDGYGLAGMLAFYTPGRPETFLWKLQERNGVAYDMWREEADLRGHDAVIVDDRGTDAWFEELRCCFESLSEPRLFEVRREGRVIREFRAVYGSGFTGFPVPDAGE